MSKTYGAADIWCMQPASAPANQLLFPRSSIPPWKLVSPDQAMCFAPQPFLATPHGASQTMQALGRPVYNHLNGLNGMSITSSLEQQLCMPSAPKYVLGSQLALPTIVPPVNIQQTSWRAQKMSTYPHYALHRHGVRILLGKRAAMDSTGQKWETKGAIGNHRLQMGNSIDDQMQERLNQLQKKRQRFRKQYTRKERRDYRRKKEHQRQRFIAEKEKQLQKLRNEVLSKEPNECVFQACVLELLSKSLLEFHERFMNEYAALCGLLAVAAPDSIILQKMDTIDSVAADIRSGQISLMREHTLLSILLNQRNQPWETFEMLEVQKTWLNIDRIITIYSLF